MRLTNKCLLLAGIALCGMLLAGCGTDVSPAQPSAELQGGSQVESPVESSAESYAESSATNRTESEATTPVESQTDSQATGQETNQESAQQENSDSAQQENSDSGQQESPDSEQEDVYVLTFEATTVDGEPMTSDIFSQSKLTMVNVWATYCNPCLREMPDLGAIAASYDPETFQIIGIVSDVTNEAGGDDINLVKELVAETQADYPHLLLNESLYVNLVGAVDAVPTTFFFNEKGELLGYLVGSYEREAWEEIITGLLAELP